MEHLGGVQPCEHSWGQFGCGWGRAGLHPSLAPFKGWEAQGQHLNLGSASFRVWGESYSMGWVIPSLF